MYAEVGAGSAVVLVHGFGGNYHHFRKLAADLSDRHRGICSASLLQGPPTCLSPYAGDLCCHSPIHWPIPRLWTFSVEGQSEHILLLKYCPLLMACAVCSLGCRSTGLWRELKTNRHKIRSAPLEGPGGGIYT